MIQRLQTVFMLLAIASLGLFLGLPLIRIETHAFFDDTAGWDVSQFYNGYFFFANAILTGIAVGLTLLSIFLYKRRSLQVLLCVFAIVFIITAQAFVYYKFQTRIFAGDVVLRKWNILSLVAVFFEMLAIYYIRKDEKLVQSMDRLR